LLTIYTTRWCHQTLEKKIKLCSFFKTERINGSGILS
jgi:hypothetical protein